LFYTRRAVKLAIDASTDADRALLIAERNAEAAADQVEVSRDTARRQLRAYLGVKDIVYYRPQRWFYINVENYGATMAHAVMLQARVENPAGVFSPYAIVGVVEPRKFVPVIIPDELEERTPSRHWSVEIAIVYTDVFGVTWDRRITFHIPADLGAVDEQSVHFYPLPGSSDEYEHKDEEPTIPSAS
jgi:hypothetical protein